LSSISLHLHCDCLIRHARHSAVATGLVAPTLSKPMNRRVPLSLRPTQRW
jgi:hypothetical protein